MASFFRMFQSGGEDEPLSTAKSIQAWVEKRPANDPMGLVIGMTHLLEEMSTRQPAATPNRVQALLTLDGLSLVPLIQLQQQYRLPSLSDDIRQQLWHARNNLARWMAYAYEQVYESIRKDDDRSKYRPLLHGVFARMFYHRGMQAKQGLFRYEQWIPAKWKFLHSAYKEALDLGVASQVFSLAPNAQVADQSSPEQEYIHFLLLQRVNTGNLSVLQIDLAAIFLREWVSKLRLVTTPPEGDVHWVLDLDQAEGLRAPGAREVGPNALYLDVTPLRDQLETAKTQLSDQITLTGSKPESREIKDRLALVRRLEGLWLPHSQQQQRRGERQPAEATVLVASGWTEIAILMREARPWRSHDPYHYTYDDAAELVARGRAPSPKSAKGDASRLHPERRGWKIVDTSDTGCRIVSTTKQAAQLQLGALLALLRETDERWRIGIIRRLKRRTADHTELGVEIIAENSVLVMPEPVVTRDSGYSVNGIDVSAKGKRFDAIYLPPQSTATAPVYSIVMPVSEYVGGKTMSITLDGEQRVVKLAVAIEYNKDWVWSTFEIIATAA